MAHLEKLYSGRRAYYGDLHNHSASGGTSDGQCTLQGWIDGMKELGMDFATILDHKQVRHMYLSEWDDGTFIGGTEPGTNISDANAENKGIHYNMIFADPKPLEKLLETFSEYEFEGGWDGHFIYPDFTRERMCELIRFIKENGGFFVLPHPKQIMNAEEPLEYFFEDEIGFEVVYRDLHDELTEKGYKLWCELLALGKRLFATAGEDRHLNPSCDALTTVYAEEKKASSYISKFRVGDFVCGAVGIKMAVGDTAMGGVCDFAGKTLEIFVGDFHSSVKQNNHTYKMLLINDKGIVCEEKISPDRDNFFEYKAENCKFYRVEIFDETENLRIAIGNPIWNE